jgi:hypothetical protein
MKKIAVLAIALGFTCVPSFAQYDDEDYGETPAATEDDSYSTEESTQAEPAEEAESAAPAAEKSSDDTDYQKIRLGGHIGVGVGGLGDLTAVGGYVGGSLRYYINKQFAVAPEVNFIFRYFYETSERIPDGYGYEYEFEQGISQILMDVPVLARYEPLSFLYVEGCLRLAFCLADMFSAQFNYYDTYDNEVDYASDLVAADDIETSSVYVSLVLGAGAQFHQGGHDMNVGLRFMYDFNSVSDSVKDKPSAWNIQLSMTYLL